MNTLPLEILAKILKYVPLPKRLKFACVCKTFREIIHSPYLMKDVNLSGNLKITDKSLKKLLERVTKVSRLNLWGCYKLNGSCLVNFALQGKFEALKSIRLGMTKVSSEVLRIVLQHSRFLVDLDLRMVIHARDDIARTLRDMTYLERLRCCGVTMTEEFFKILFQVASFGPALKVLDICGMRLSKKTLIQITQRCINLQILCLQGSYVDKDFLKKLAASCKHLSFLCICKPGITVNCQPQQTSAAIYFNNDVTICDGTFPHHFYLYL